MLYSSIAIIVCNALSVWRPLRWGEGGGSSRQKSGQARRNSRYCNSIDVKQVPWTRNLIEEERSKKSTYNEPRANNLKEQSVIVYQVVENIYQVAVFVCCTYLHQFIVIPNPKQQQQQQQSAAQLASRKTKHKQTTTNIVSIFFFVRGYG